MLELCSSLAAVCVLTAAEMLQTGETTCAVCWDQEPDAVIVPCGHLCLCHVCAELVTESGDGLCPVCRMSISQTIRIG